MRNLRNSTETTLQRLKEEYRIVTGIDYEHDDNDIVFDCPDYSRYHIAWLRGQIFALEVCVLGYLDNPIKENKKVTEQAECNRGFQPTAKKRLRPLTIDEVLNIIVDNNGYLGIINPKTKQVGILENHRLEDEGHGSKWDVDFCGELVLMDHETLINSYKYLHKREDGKEYYRSFTTEE